MSHYVRIWNHSWISGFHDVGREGLIRTSRECRWELLMSLAVIIKVIIVDVCLLVLLTFSPIRFPDWRCPTAIPIDFIESRGSHDWWPLLSVRNATTFRRRHELSPFKEQLSPHHSRPAEQLAAPCRDDSPKLTCPRLIFNRPQQTGECRIKDSVCLTAGSHIKGPSVKATAAASGGGVGEPN